MIKYLKTQAGRLVDIFVKTMDPSQHINVRIRSAIAAGSVIYHIEEDPDVYKAFSSIVPYLIEVTRICVDEQMVESMSCFESLEQVIESIPNLINNQFLPILELCMNVSINSSLSWDIRHSSLTLIQLLIQFKTSFFIKSGVLKDVIDLFVQLGLENYDSNDQENPHQIACELIEHTAQYFKPKHTYQHFIQRIQELSQSPNIPHKTMAIGILRSICSGCQVEMINDIEHFLPYLLDSLSDNNIEIRKEACILLGKFFKYLSPEILDFHDKLIPIIFTLFDDNTEIQKMACYSLQQFVQNIDMEILSVYLDEMIKLLITLFDRTYDIIIKELVISTISFIAKDAKSLILPYFETLILLLKELVALDEPQYILLRARALNTVGYMSIAVGKEAFLPYADYFLTKAFESFSLDSSNTETSSQSDYVDLYSCVYHFIECAAESLQQSFEPYLSTTMKFALSSLNKQENIKEEQLVGLDPELIAIKKALNISNLEERVAALSCVGFVARYVGELFGPYFNECLELAERHSLSIFPTCRITVDSVMENFLIMINDVYQPSQGSLLSNEAQSFLNNYVESLLPKIMADPDIVVVLRHTQSLYLLIEKFGLGMKHFIDKIIEVIVNIFEDKITGIEDAFEDLDNDKVMQDVNDIYTAACDIIICLFTVYKEEFLPLFDRITPSLVKFLESEEEHKDDVKFLVIGVFGAVAENVDIRILSKENVAVYLAQAFKGVHSPLTNSKRNGVYLLGQLFVNEHTIPYYEMMLEALLSILTTETDDIVLDNACGALGRAFLNAHHLIPYKDVIIEQFLSKLPLRADHDEDKPTYTSLIHLINSQVPEIANYIDIIFKMFILLLGDEEIEVSLRETMASTISDLWNKYQNELQSVVEQLSSDDLENFKMSLSFGKNSI